jgi:hypothetical protein
MRDRCPVVLLLACLAAIILVFSSSARILDPQSPRRDQVLTELADGLDRLNIDVILGATSTILSSGRPRLANLANFSTSHGRTWDHLKDDDWGHGFGEGFVGAIVAIRAEAKSGTPPDGRVCSNEVRIAEEEACKFLDDWVGSNLQSRVFLAFTRSDFPTAVQVMRLLEMRGYKVFLYLKDKAGPPWASPALVAEFFSQAAHRLIIDTTQSRNSEAVEFEASCARLLVSTGPPDTELSKLLKLHRP